MAIKFSGDVVTLLLGQLLYVDGLNKYVSQILVVGLRLIPHKGNLLGKFFEDCCSIDAEISNLVQLFNTPDLIKHISNVRRFQFNVSERFSLGEEINHHVQKPNEVISPAGGLEHHLAY